LFLASLVALTPLPVLSADGEVSLQGDTMTLESLLSQVQARNPEIAAAKQELEAARQRIAPARALENPMLEVGILNLPVESLSLRREDMTMKMLGVSQRLPFPGKRDLRAAVASADAQSVAFGYDETVNRITRDAHIAYVELSLVRRSREIVMRNRAAVEQFLRVAEGRYSVGQGAQPDVLKAQTQLTRMTDELLRNAREEATMQAELRRMLDSAADAAPILPAPIPPRSGELNGEALRRAAAEHRPQLHGLESEIARYDREVELMQREFYPDFDVRLSYGQRDRALDGMNREDMVSLSVAIDLPIWRKSRLAPQVAQARAMRERAREMHRAQSAEVSAALETQLATARQSRRSLELIETALLPQSRLAVESSLAAYRVGRVDFATLLDNQMLVYTYESELARAGAAYEEALAQIDFVVGATRE
jgi:outer membrane protein TolC